MPVDALEEGDVRASRVNRALEEAASQDVAAQQARRASEATAAAATQPARTEPDVGAVASTQQDRGHDWRRFADRTEALAAESVETLAKEEQRRQRQQEDAERLTAAELQRAASGGKLRG